MPAWASTADLLVYAPDIQDYGQTDWSAELALAQADVREWVVSSWWAPILQRRGFWPPYYELDETLLNIAALKPATCFRALGWEILPKLAKWSDQDGDSFSRRAEWFQRRYHDELGKVSKMALYDWSRDGRFADWERDLHGRTIKVVRA